MRRSCGSSLSSIAGGGASGLSSSISSEGRTAAGVDTGFAAFVLEGATGVGVMRFRLPGDGRAAGVFCGEALRGCGVFCEEGGGGSAGAPPKEKLNAAFLISRGLPSHRR
jgi:hypothetical protein